MAFYSDNFLFVILMFFALWGIRLLVTYKRQRDLTKKKTLVPKPLPPGTCTSQPSLRNVSINPSLPYQLYFNDAEELLPLSA
jgi:hypothetical protein